jgi:ABC-2 type transport system permease protein
MKAPTDVKTPRPGHAPLHPDDANRLAPMAVGGLVGFRTLLFKEVLRFWKVSFQTVAAPVLTAILYLLIFGHVLEDRVKVYDQISYTAFLVPGLVMMSVLQNAFANSSSSLIQSKITGNLVFVLLPPLSHWEMFGAYVVASVVRGLAVGVGVLLVTGWFADLHVANVGWILVFALLGAAMLGSLGLIAGIWAEKFDQLAAFQNFLIMPATFLSGVFYSIHSLPPFWQKVSHANPFFYMIDGFRYGFFGVSDVSPVFSLAVVGSAFVVVAAIALRLLKTGFKLRH